MKLILTSSDFKQEEIFKKVLEFVGKPAQDISVAVLMEASAVEEGDKRWLINGLNLISKSFGGEIDIINLLALDIKETEQRIEKADIIFCFGGNADWLKIVFDKSNFTNLLPKLLNKKVWIGSSAGSIILGNKPSAEIDNYIYAEKRYTEVKNYLGLVNFSIFPHLLGDIFPEDSFEKCIEESKLQNYPVFVLSDTSAVVVEDDKIYLAGKNAYKLEAGTVTEKR